MTNKKRQVYDEVRAATVAVCLLNSTGRLVPFGSGINIDPAGIIVTCKHVIEGALVKFDGQPKESTLPRVDNGWRHSMMLPMRDMVAVFSLVEAGKLEMGIARFEIVHGLHELDIAVGRLKPEGQLPAVPLADSDEVYEGQLVFTCGFPLGPDLQPKNPVGALFHRGIIAGIRPHYLIQPRREFLLDMSINPGNSGGPLCAEDNGQVLGVVNALIQDGRSRTGIGCAVPANLVKSLVQTVSALTEQQIEEMGTGKWPSNMPIV